MVEVEPRQVVEPAARVALPYGLSSVINLRPDGGDSHWPNGVTWEALSCAPASGIGNIECSDPTSGIGLPKFFSRDGVPIGTADPFVVFASHLCGPVGQGSRALMASQEKATQLLLNREAARAEKAFWTGDLGNTPNLRGAVDLNAAGAVSPPVALGLLEDFMGDTYGSVGVIHMSRKAEPTFAHSYLLEASGGRMMTSLETPVAVGAGYDDSSPSGAAAAAGTAWIYVTPAIFGYRSEIDNATDRQGDLFDQANNDLYGIAERWYLLGFDPCGVGAVRVTLGCC